MSVELYQGDAVQWAREYDGPLFHALLCDAPYHLTSPAIGWDRYKGKSGRITDRSPAGFMGKEWDGGDVAFRPETWAAFMRVLHPGAFCMAFAGSRGWHRMAVAIEDAGFIIHPSLFGWAYGSGFPKATRVDTQIDRAAGAEREVIGERRQRANSINSLVPMNASAGDVELITAPATDLARAFAGHRYGLQALKPALEPIICFQKPYAGRPIDCITATGAGVLNVDGGRIAGDYETRERDTNGGTSMFGTGAGGGAFVPTSGRWPSNFLLLSDAAAAALDRQSGVMQSHSRGKLNKSYQYANPRTYGEYADSTPSTEYLDTGGASRFFYVVREQIDAADPVRYVAKSSRRERDAGLEGMPLKNVPRGSSNNLKQWESGERSFDELDEKSKAFATQCRNVHPTVKPLALTRYLATLLLPPAEYAPRRIFIPFAGVMSEGIGAMQAGWDEVVGVELTEEYLPIARARVEYWQAKREQQMEMEL